MSLPPGVPKDRVDRLLRHIAEEVDRMSVHFIRCRRPDDFSESDATRLLFLSMSGATIAGIAGDAVSSDYFKNVMVGMQMLLLARELVRIDQIDEKRARDADAVLAEALRTGLAEASPKAGAGLSPATPDEASPGSGECR